MSKVAVMGAAGRMGQEIIQVLESKETPLSFSLGHSRSDQRYCSSLNQWDADQVIAVIDFSLPNAFAEVLSWCVTNKKPLVSGTTGLKAEDFEQLSKASSEIPVLWAPNMSLGVALLKKAMSVFANAKWFDFAIEEFHHSQKKDRPSGTAIHLRDTLEKHIGRNIEEVSAIRGGGIYGVHSVYAMSEDEVLEFKHSALNRSVFASGAVKSCEWLIDKKPGIYELSDVIGEAKP